MKRSSQEMASAKGVYPMKYKEKAQLVNGNMKIKNPQIFYTKAWQIWLSSSTGKGQHRFPPSNYVDTFPLISKLNER